MAPLKYEDKMRNKLESRSIEPSNNSWEKLSKRLDNHEEKKSKKNVFWFLKIAAAIVGVVWISSTIFFSETVIEIEPQIVDTPKIDVNKLENNSIEDDTQKFIKEIEKGTSEDVETITTEVVIVKQKQENKINKKEEVLKNINEVESIAIANVKVQKEVEKKPELISLDAVKDENVEVLVAQIVELKEQNKEITDAEIDDLLNMAQDEIRLKKLYKNNSKTVDAMALLQDVEADLDRSFRKKVFEALKINYNNVKTAVAQRND
jgi:hypothetical protein